jgi:dihydrofolate synthase / folylpolyglutamate synthase
VSQAEEAYAHPTLTLPTYPDVTVPPDESYARALRFWYGRINYEQRTPQPGDFGLDRMRTLLARLGNPERTLRIIHVAGSKGKGSTSAMLAAILQRAGYRTGLFTSPHLCAVEERIQVDGQPISQRELTALLEDVRVAVEERSARLEPTFFEVATAVGFLHFARRRVQAAVVEVGLGGRLDSTNVCRQPLVSVITSISFDHTQQLGPTLASIAREKAGIVKPGVETVSGATAPEARAVIEEVCSQRHAPLSQLGVDFRYRYEPGRITATHVRRPRVQVQTHRQAWPWLELGLFGEHQAANAAVALVCIEHLRALGWRLDDESVAAGLAEVRWAARLEVVCRQPMIVLDCAHNLASAQAVVETLRACFPLPADAARRLLVFAGSSDKDLAGMFQVLAPHFDHAFLTRYRDNPRSVPPERLAEMWRRAGKQPYTLFSNAAQAWDAARAAAGPDDLICVTGSVFLAGELRPLLLQETGKTRTGKLGKPSGR